MTYPTGPLENWASGRLSYYYPSPGIVFWGFTQCGTGSLEWRYRSEMRQWLVMSLYWCVLSLQIQHRRLSMSLRFKPGKAEKASLFAASAALAGNRGHCLARPFGRKPQVWWQQNSHGWRHLFSWQQGTGQRGFICYDFLFLWNNILIWATFIWI